MKRLPKFLTRHWKQIGLSALCLVLALILSGMIFVTVFVEQWTGTKEHRPALLGVGATVLCLWLFGRDVFLIPSMIIITLALTALRPRLDGKEAERHE